MLYIGTSKNIVETHRYKYYDTILLKITHIYTGIPNNFKYIFLLISFNF